MTKWIEGSIFPQEGCYLLRLILEGGYKRIIEIGTFTGFSTNYLAVAALFNGGAVHTVDRVCLWGGIWRGSLIKWWLRPWVRQHFCDAVKYLKHQPDESAEFIFEDSAHDYGTTSGVIREARRVLRDGGMLVLHDVFSEPDWVKVKDAIDDSGLEFRTICAGAPNGLAIWVKPKKAVSDQFKYLMRACHGDSEEYAHMLKAEPGIPPDKKPVSRETVWKRLKKRRVIKGWWKTHVKGTGISRPRF